MLKLGRKMEKNEMGNLMKIEERSVEERDQREEGRKGEEKFWIILLAKF